MAPGVNKNEIAVFSVFLVLFLFIAALVNFPEIPKYNYLFGGEYGKIAEALVNGKGYANPFGTKSGSTAWMSPLYTFLLALIFWIFGPYTPASVWSILGLKYLALSIVPILLMRICRRTYPGAQSYLVLPIYLCLIFYSRGTFFSMTDDVWLVLLMIAVLFYTRWYYLNVSRSKMLKLGWGILGGLLFLTSPILGAVYIFLTFVPNNKTGFKKKLAMVVLSLIICSPWLVRNYLVFDRIVFVKSNLFFELYQSNYLDEDGVIDLGTFQKFHPFLNEKIRETYTSLGETRFLAKYRDAFLSEFKNNPLVFLKKAGHRFLRAFIVPASMVPHKKSHWFYGNLKSFVKAAVYWIPIFMSIYFLFAKGIPDTNTLRAGATLFLAYLAPYVVVGFYKRYRIPLVPIFAIFYFYFVMHMREVWQRKRLRHTEQQITSKHWDLPLVEEDRS